MKFFVEIREARPTGCARYVISFAVGVAIFFSLLAALSYIAERAR